MKIKHFTFAVVLLAVATAFLAFYVPGSKVSATTTWGRIGVNNSCGPGTLVCNASGSPIKDGNKDVFNSKMYINKRGQLVMEFDKDFVPDSLRILQFEEGVYKIDQECRINERSLLGNMGVTDSVIIINIGNYPVKKGWGKYIVTFGENIEKAKENNEGSSD